ncbi:hypothetical protein [Actinoplanes sp. NPDC026619]|uniref:hypothetical protein n=1 Tax=Actinoplanes sp. NPDC026619 TaxID=3155798 RepID=UPI0034047610
MIPQLLIGVALAAAPVSYNPQAMTGFVGESEVRAAYGWSAATLAKRADALEFSHEFWTDDTYSVSCGGDVFPVVHHHDFGRFGLVFQKAHAAGGYGKLTGFRITGANWGISGTSVPPMVGQPCPSEGRGPTVKKARKVSTTKGCTLTVTSADVRRDLFVC